MQLKNTFVQGTLNKDVDERLVPNGQYPDALNIRVSNTDGSDVGAIENVKGNEALTSLGLTNAKAIGSFADDSNQLLYWFVTSDEEDQVLEYNMVTSTLATLLRSTAGTILNFDENFLITGVNKIVNEDGDNDLLFWTDDRNPPRFINISRYRGSALDSFTAEEIMVIKAPPVSAPTFTFAFTTESSVDSMEDKWFSFAYRYEYEDGMYSALSSFTNYAFSPSSLDIDLDTLENNGMRNQFNALNITMNTGNDKVVGFELVVKESNSNALYIVERFDKLELDIANNDPYVFNFINDKSYTQLPEDELFRSYDNVPLLAKAQEYVGSRIIYGNYVEGFDMKDINGDKIRMDYTPDIVSTELGGEVLPYTLGNSDKTINIDLTDVPLTQGTRLDIFLAMSGVPPENLAIYNETFVFILERDYVDIADLTGSTEFISFVEDTMTEIFFANETSTPPLNTAESVNTPFSFVVVGNELRITTPSTLHTVDNTPVDNDITDGDVTLVNYEWAYTADLSEISFSLESTTASVKSLRNLEVGVIYMDEFNRRSPVQIGLDNTVDIPITLANSQNKLRVTLRNRPPADAVRYKFAIKQNRGFYENVFCTQFFLEDQFVWVKLEEASKDKVKAGDVLYVKRDTRGILDSVVKVTVLEVTFKAENFIQDNFFNQATGELVETAGTGVSEIIEPSGTYMKIKAVGFDMAYNANRFFKQKYRKNSDSTFPTVNVTGYRGVTSNPDNAFPIEQGATVTLDISNSVERTSRIAKAKRTYIAGNAYPNFRDFYLAEVGLASITPDSGTASAGSAFQVSDSGIGINIRGIFDGYGKRRTANTTVNLTIENSNGLTVFETIPDNNLSEIFYETSETFEIVNGEHQGKEQAQQFGGSPQDAIHTLDFFNCFAMGENIESIAYLDGFNKPNLNIDLRPSTTTLAEFRRVRRYADLTYSEPYNENSQLNGLNEFNLGRANFKDDMDKSFGFIQLLHGRDTDLIVFQEDKVSKVLYGKDILNTADGGGQVSTIEGVLGQQVAFPAEYGISKNPESFASYGYNIYFIDAKRGAVLRLGASGIDEISAQGLRTFFRDNLRGAINNIALGEFDPHLDQYIVHLDKEAVTTLSHDERAGGWTSRHSFRPEFMQGMNNEFFTFFNGNLYKHHSDAVARNEYYGIQYPSSITLMQNASPSEIKMVQAAMLEGNLPWNTVITAFITNTDDIMFSTIDASEYQEKEGLWYAYARRNEATHFDSKSSYGIGLVTAFNPVTNEVTINGYNSSIAIGDILVNEALTEIGEITAAQTVNGITTVTLTGTLGLANGQFVIGTKDNRIEGGNLRGYVIKIDLETNASGKAELFAVNTEVKKSFS